MTAVRENEFPRHCDIAIVGGGILGLCIAHEIAGRARDLSIALIAPRDRSGGASEAAGAMLSGYGETTTLSFATEGARLKSELRLQAAAYWPAWIERLNDAGDGPRVALRDGTLTITNAVSGPLDEQNLEAMVELLRAREARFEFVAPAQVEGLRPKAPSRPQRAVFLPEERYVDGATVLVALEEQLLRHPRVMLVDEPCTQIRAARRHGAAHEVVTAGGSIGAGRIVLAAGAACDGLVRGLGANRVPRIFCGAGAALLCATPQAGPALDIAVRTPNRAFACGLHALPHVRGGLYLGATNNVQVDPIRAASLGDVAFIAECAMQQIDRNLPSSALLATLVGNRPVPADTFPLLGETSWRGIWLATGTYRDGFLLAPLIARSLADALAADEAVLRGAALFRPERPPLAAVPDLKSAIAEGVENYVAAAFERGANLPSAGAWEDEFRAVIERRVAAIYARFEPPFIPPPDLLWDIERGDLGGALIDYYAQAAAHWR